jgi:hypothetical protein
MPDHTTEMRVVKNDANVDVVAEERTSQHENTSVYFPYSPLTSDLEIGGRARQEETEDGQSVAAVYLRSRGSIETNLLGLSMFKGILLKVVLDWLTRLRRLDLSFVIREIFAKSSLQRCGRF